MSDLLRLLGALLKHPLRTIRGLLHWRGENTGPDQR